MRDVLLPVEADQPERELDELADGVHLTGRDDVVVRLVVLEHQPHRLDVLGRVSPVAAGVEVAEVQLVGLAGDDRGDAAGHLAGDEGRPAPRRLVVEQDAVGREDPVGLAILDRHLVGEHLGGGVWAAGRKASSPSAGVSATWPYISLEPAW